MAANGGKVTAMIFLQLFAGKERTMQAKQSSRNTAFANAFCAPACCAAMVAFIRTLNVQLGVLLILAVLIICVLISLIVRPSVP